MAFANLGFETAGALPGQAASWTLAIVSTAVAIAIYEHDPGAPLDVSAAETFEGYWTSNHDFLPEFDDPVTQLDAGTFTTLLPMTKFVEDFDEMWTSNHLNITSLVLLEEAVYDGLTPLTEETFESGWTSNFPLYTTFTDGVTNEAAVFTSAGGPVPYDNFDSAGWTYPFYSTLDATGNEAASYDTIPEAFEDFEELWGLEMETV
jgi:hypothetical protein